MLFRLVMPTTSSGLSIFLITTSVYPLKKTWQCLIPIFIFFFLSWEYVCAVSSVSTCLARLWYQCVHQINCNITSQHGKQWHFLRMLEMSAVLSGTLVHPPVFCCEEILTFFTLTSCNAPTGSSLETLWLDHTVAFCYPQI